MVEEASDRYDGQAANQVYDLNPMDVLHRAPYHVRELTIKSANPATSQQITRLKRMTQESSSSAIPTPSSSSFFRSPCQMVQASNTGHRNG